MRAGCFLWGGRCREAREKRGYGICCRIAIGEWVMGEGASAERGGNAKRIENGR